jgi:hypothetical protein
MKATLRTASPFTHMAQALQRLQPPAPPQAAPADTERRSPVACMLRELAQGPRDAAYLAAAAGVKSALVMPLLKNHLRARRVFTFQQDGRTVYELQSTEAADLAHQIQRACQLLRAHGYRVEPRQ